MSRLSQRRTSQAGFTLIELMVALGLSLLLAVALITMQASLGKQTMRNSDVGLRDTQSRAALDLITQDLSSGGFLFGGSENLCNALFTYNGSAYFTHHPVDAVAAASGAAMGFAQATGTNSLTLNYPPSTMPSDVLVTTGSTDATNFNSLTFPLVNVSPNAAYTPSTTGNVPLISTTGMANNDVGILQAPMSGKLACMRVPFKTVTAAEVDSLGTTMPSNFYAGFATQTSAAGFTGTLTDAEIFSGHMVDIGQTATPTQQTIAYYVDNSGTYPVLMRATYSLLDDSLIGTPQPIAAGVVSLQVRFGVDTTNTGVVTPPYLTAAAVTTANQWDLVRSVRVALVSRSLTDDPDSTYYWTTSASAPTPGASANATSAGSVKPGNNFTDVPVPAGSHRRYLLQQTEIAARNLMWSH